MPPSEQQLPHCFQSSLRFPERRRQGPNSPGSDRFILLGPPALHSLGVCCMLVRRQAGAGITGALGSPLGVVQGITGMELGEAGDLPVPPRPSVSAQARPLGPPPCGAPGSTLLSEPWERPHHGGGAQTAPLAQPWPQRWATGLQLTSLALHLACHPLACVTPSPRQARLQSQKPDLLQQPDPQQSGEAGSGTEGFPG
ncbi:hypothetical protein GH733_003128 [Mirounga leonina]|nr:hypothetical protein GH733_003128 [Mirounga leonina]